MTDFERFGVKPSLGGNRRSAIHNYIVYLIVSALKNAGIHDINWDHVSLPYIKADIPLEFEGQRYDISAIVSDHIIFIEIKTISRSKYLATEGDRHGEGDLIDPEG